MKPETEIKLIYENNIPKHVVGNLEKFKLALMTALEFSIKYCQQGTIQVKVEFDMVLANRDDFMVKVSLKMPLNQSYNT